MSRTVRFHETGGPDVLKIEDIETPYPGRGEVRIAVKAIGINRSESMYRSGVYVIAPTFPAILGYEAAGIIEAIGPDVIDLAVGDIVSTTPAFSYSDYGMYGELVLAPAQAVVKHPHGLSTEKAAATWVSYLTAWGALVDVARLERGDFVLIPAASSSVGLAAIQIARQVGAIPIALTRTSAKLAALKDLGAVHVVATGESDLVAEVMRVTDGSGARVVFDPGRRPHLRAACRSDRHERHDGRIRRFEQRGDTVPAVRFGRPSSHHPGFRNRRSRRQP